MTQSVVTTRESFVQVARGGESSEKLRLTFDDSSDAILVVNPHQLSASCGQDKPVLQVVVNPFLLACFEDADLNEVLRDNPTQGALLVETYQARVRASMESALATGADGVFYVLDGARGAYSTPMEYGGFHLESDRELLSLVQDARLNIVFVVGNDDLYIDFVSDLPAHLFAWDAEGSTFSSNYLRTLRSGAQASNDSDSEVFFDFNQSSVHDFLGAIKNHHINSNLEQKS